MIMPGTVLEPGDIDNQHTPSPPYGAHDQLKGTSTFHAAEGWTNTKDVWETRGRFSAPGSEGGGGQHGRLPGGRVELPSLLYNPFHSHSFLQLDRLLTRLKYLMSLNISIFSLTPHAYTHLF